MRNLFFLAALAGLSVACATAPTQPMGAEQRREQAEAVTTRWYTYSEVMALQLIEEYGAPDRIEPDRLTWDHRGPWDKIAVWNAEDYYYSGTMGPDNLEQTLAYEVPADKRKALAAFSAKLKVSKDGKEITVRGNDEALNLLALNLAHELVRGVRDPDDARSFYDRTYRLSLAGKSSDYMERLLFMAPAAASPRY
ncbi:MAG: hypothetical protein NTY77_15065 [Elusimicrobia bacterium]|nr:hypothetical protein [Elusimicrobiota bacterium]